MRKPIGPVNDRQTAKQIEKTQKSRAKQWQDALKKAGKEKATLERKEMKESKRRASELKKSMKNKKPPVAKVVEVVEPADTIPEVTQPDANEHPIWDEINNFQDVQHNIQDVQHNFQDLQDVPAAVTSAVPKRDLLAKFNFAAANRPTSSIHDHVVVMRRQQNPRPMVVQNRDSLDADPPTDPAHRWSTSNDVFGEKRISKIPAAYLEDDPSDVSVQEEVIEEPAVEHLVCGTKTNAINKQTATNSQPDAATTEKEFPFIANHVLPNINDSRDVSTRRAEQAHAIAKPLINEQARGAPELIGKKSAYTTNAREMQRQASMQDIASHKVNEQARGAPELIGKPNHFTADSAEMTRQRTVPRVRRVNPNVMTDGAVSRDKQADASWSINPLGPGETHNVAVAPFTIDYSKTIAETPRPEDVKETKEDFTQFYFEGLEKEEGICLLKMVNTAGAFVIIPDAQRSRLKFSLIFLHRGKVTSHAIVRPNAGGAFTVGCAPFMLINQVRTNVPHYQQAELN